MEMVSVGQKGHFGVGAEQAVLLDPAHSVTLVSS